MSGAEEAFQAILLAEQKSLGQLETAEDTSEDASLALALVLDEELNAVQM